MHMMASIGGEIKSLTRVSEEVIILKVFNKTEPKDNNDNDNNVYPIFVFKKKARYIERK